MSTYAHWLFHEPNQKFDTISYGSDRLKQLSFAEILSIREWTVQVQLFSPNPRSGIGICKEKNS